MKIFHIKAADATRETENRFADLVTALAGLGISQYVLMAPHEKLETAFSALDVPFTVQKFSGLFDLRTQQAAQQIAESFGPHIIQTHSPDAGTLAGKIQNSALRVSFADGDDTQRKKALATNDILLSTGYPQQGSPLDYDILPVLPLVRDLCPAPEEATPKEQPLIGTMIDLTRQSGLETVLRALRETPKVRFRIYGDGPAKKELQNTARLQAIQDRVEFIEDEPDPGHFLRSLDICIVPLRPHGVDRLTLEAWSCGTCVLSGMPPERSPITPAEDGWLVDNNEVLKWRGKLQALLDSPDIRKASGDAGRRKYLDSYNADRVISSYLQAYETALRIKI